MFGFEFEPQLSFLDPRMAKKKIYLNTETKFNKLFQKDQYIFESKYSDEVTLKVPSKFKHIDSDISSLEIRNSHPFKTIDLALEELDDIVENAANQLYNFWKIPFAIIIPPNFCLNFSRYISKHLSIHTNTLEYRKPLKQIYKKVYNGEYNDIIKTKTKFGMRYHIRLPYSFTNYSVENIISYLIDIRDNFYIQTFQKKYDFNNPLVIGIRSRQKWIRLNNFF